MGTLGCAPGEARRSSRCLLASPTVVTRYITGLGTFQSSDFTPLALFGNQYLGAAVRPDSSIKSARDLMERLKRDLISTHLRNEIESLYKARQAS